MCMESEWYKRVCDCFVYFNDTATTENYTYCHTLSLPDALPILPGNGDRREGARRRSRAHGRGAHEKGRFASAGCRSLRSRPRVARQLGRRSTTGTQEGTQRGVQKIARYASAGGPTRPHGPSLPWGYAVAETH